VKTELLRVGKNDNYEITVRGAGGQFGLHLIGPCSISIVKKGAKDSVDRFRDLRECKSEQARERVTHSAHAPESHERR
jgi:hypothetical protein